MSKKILLSLFLMIITVFIINRVEVYNGEPSDTEVNEKKENQSAIKTTESFSKGEPSAIKENEQEQLFKVDLSSYDLILVNYNHSFSDEQLPDEVGVIDNYYQVHQDLVAPYNEMKSAAAKEGINLKVVSTYRSVSYQKEVYADSIKDNIAAGMTEEEAKADTAVYVAEPGTSEHHTGLAIDLVDDTWLASGKGLVEEFIGTKAGKWLDSHCTDYGFIIRFPKGKEDITKINYEPWHLRFVGVEPAKFIKDHQLTLEEYIELVEKTQNKKK